AVREGDGAGLAHGEEPLPDGMGGKFVDGAPRHLGLGELLQGLLANEERSQAVALEHEAEVKLPQGAEGVAVAGLPRAFEAEEVLVGRQGGEVVRPLGRVVRPGSEGVLLGAEFGTVIALVGLALIVGPGAAGRPVADGGFSACHVGSPWGWACLMVIPCVIPCKVGWSYFLNVFLIPSYGD